MSKIELVNPQTCSTREVSSEAEWKMLSSLARLFRIDEVSGAVTITNGDASITLLPDGTIRLDGARLVHAATERILLVAPRIDLN